jgi:hypothetical protein
MVAPVVGAQDQGHILERDDDRQAPEDQGNDAEDVRRVERQAVFLVEDGPQGVEGAGTDIAIDDADRSQGQRRQAAFLVLGRQDCTMFLFWCGAP